MTNRYQSHWKKRFQYLSFLLASALCRVAIAQEGVQPNIQAVLLPKRTDKKALSSDIRTTVCQITERLLYDEA